MDEEKILTLRKPVKLGEETYTALTLREPSAGELRRASDSGDGMALMINLLSFVAGVPHQVIERIGVRDFTEASTFVGGFIGGGPLTGPTA